MARYNTVTSVTSSSGTNTIPTPSAGLLTTFTGSAPYTVTLASPVQFLGTSQSFFNNTGGVVTLSAPSGNIKGPGFTAATTQTMPNQSSFTLTSDGTDYVVTNNEGGPQLGVNLTLTGNTASTDSTTGTLKVTGGIGAGGQLNVAGAVNKFTGGTASTLTTDGTVIVTGGVGISGAINVGGGVNKFSGGTASTLTTDGTVVVTGGVGVSGQINVGGAVNKFSGGTASTTTTDGTVVVTGGVGISGALNVGGAISGNGSSGILSYAIATGAASIADSDRFYLVISTSSFTLTLPATSTNGRTLVFGDGSNFGAFPITLARNTKTIGGLAEDLILNLQGSRVELVYYSGDWKVFVI